MVLKEKRAKLENETKKCELSRAYAKMILFVSLQPILRSKNFAKILAKPFLKKKLL